MLQGSLLSSLSLKSPMSSPSSTDSPLAAASASAASRAATISCAFFFAHTSGLKKKKNESLFNPLAPKI